MWFAIQQQNGQRPSLSAEPASQIERVLPCMDALAAFNAALQSAIGYRLFSMYCRVYSSALQQEAAICTA